MNEVYFAIAAVILVLIIIIAIYNTIIGRANAAKRAWSDVITYERGKLKVLEPIQKMLTSHQEFESKLLNDVTALRERLGNLTVNSGTDELASIEKASRNLFAGIHATAEAYPDLKTSSLYSQVMAEISDQQENVNAAIAIFNRNVEDHNNIIEQFPSSLVNSMLNKRQAIAPFNDATASEAFTYKPNL